MLGINGGEILLLVLIAILVIGPNRMPEYAAKLARGIRQARRRRAVGEQQEERAAGEPADEVVQHGQGRRVGPLDVVDHEEDRGDVGLDGQQVGDGLEQQVALDVG